MTTLSLELLATDHALPTPEELHKEIPLTESQSAFILRSRETFEAILNGWDNRCILIAGPCSIHDPKAAREYAEKFSRLSKYVSDQFFLVMRTYFEKSRTTVGWKGMLYDPDMDGSHNMVKGIRQTRKLVSELTSMQVPLASELLEINTAHYYADFLTWGCVGARTSSSPPHRQLVSSLNFPVGFKNSTDGNMEYPINGILAAAASHVYLGLSPSGKMARVHTEGNPLCHLVLRGSHLKPNYYPETVNDAIARCRAANIPDAVLIDCAHGNSGKTPGHQKVAFESVIEQICQGNSKIAGIMLESYLNSGSQTINFPLSYGVSITDPCISWETTEELILSAHSKLRKRN